MSQLHAELSEQAYELGFESIGEAEQAGYGVDWERHKLIDPQEMAHREWVKDKDNVLLGLYVCLASPDIDKMCKQSIEDAINFIKKGEV